MSRNLKHKVFQVLKKNEVCCDFDVWFVIITGTNGFLIDDPVRLGSRPGHGRGRCRVRRAGGTTSSIALICSIIKTSIQTDKYCSNSIAVVNTLFLILDTVIHFCRCGSLAVPLRPVGSEDTCCSL